LADEDEEAVEVEVEVEEVEEVEEVAVEEVVDAELESDVDDFVSLVDSFFDEDSADEDAPFADPEDDDRESVMYQPLPLKTMPTGWMTLRNAPPHCSQVVSGGSEKLWRFSIMSSQAVHL
jgi:hypothetical protein